MPSANPTTDGQHAQSTRAGRPVNHPTNRPTKTADPPNSLIAVFSRPNEERIVEASRKDLTHEKDDWHKRNSKIIDAKHYLHSRKMFFMAVNDNIFFL